MSVTTPPSVDTLPAAPDPGNRATYNTLAYPWSAALPTFSTQVSAVGANVYANATDAASSASSAAAQATNAAASASAAATTAGAAAWVNGNTYALNVCAISQIDFQTYRKKTASSVTTTDPSADPANWVQVGGSNIGTGGTTSTGSITLTASSPAAMTITPATPGLYITLPDATTCTKADNLYSVYNAGDFDYGVKDSTGTQLGWIRPKTGAMIGLSDSSTAAGVWAYYGLEKIGVTASYTSPTLANMSMDASHRPIYIDANRTCILFGGTDCYAIVYDASTATWGSATLVRSSVQSAAFIGILSAANQVLVCSNNSTTGMEAVTLTISGTTVTVNSGTKATATLGTNWSTYYNLIAVSTSFAIAYMRTGGVAGVRAISVSGTTPTIGSEQALSAPNGTAIFASGSVLRTVCADATNIYCAPFTVSGSTLTGGTPTSAGTTAAGFRAILNGNGNIVAHYSNTTHYATVFKLTGTTESASNVSLGTVPPNISNYTDYAAISAGKTAFVWTDGSTGYYCNILTDTAGTASAGTRVSLPQSSTVTTVQCLLVTGNSLRAGVNANSNHLTQYIFDCSGASPSVSSASTLIFSTAIGGGNVFPSDMHGVRSASTLIAGSSIYLINGGGAAVYDTLLTQNSIKRLQTSAITNFAYRRIGSASNEAWANYTIGSATTGIYLTRVEAAA